MITYLHHHHRDLVQESSFLSEPLSFEPVALSPVERFPQSFHVDIEWNPRKLKHPTLPGFFWFIPTDEAPILQKTHVKYPQNMAIAEIFKGSS